MGKKILQEDGILQNSKVSDSCGKVIFENNLLCYQFIRDYIELPILKDIRPEDVEDVSGQFVPMFEEERNADRVKRIHIRGEEGAPPFFLLSIIEHKTKVEYNVCMQIFRYMVYIWNAYEKEMEKKHKGISRRKDFKYPAILPIVYYEGKEQWTAPLDFKSRVSNSDTLGKYVPEFKYHLVPIQKYSNDELLSREDEISLVMLINKMQTVQDVEAFGDVPDDKLGMILKDSPNDIIDIVADMFMAFQLKAKVPVDIAVTNVRRVKETKMTKYFENADFGDLYAKSLQVKAQREELAKTTEELSKTTEELTKAKETLENAIKVFIQNMQEYGMAREKVMGILINQYNMTIEIAEEKMKQHWEKKI